MRLFSKLLSYLFATIITTTIIPQAFADVTGPYLGGGIGYGMQNLSINDLNNTPTGTPSIRAFAGYQFASWVGAELGYTYITQTSDWNKLGAVSSTIYDFSFTPGFTIPTTPVTIYSRLGIDAISANINSSFYNQFVSNMSASFVWGGGVKLDIPGTHAFVRAEYINYGNAINNNNSMLNTNPSALMLTAAYVF
jgi:hypothetical protein